MVTVDINKADKVRMGNSWGKFETGLSMKLFECSLGKILSCPKKVFNTGRGWFVE